MDEAGRGPLAGPVFAAAALVKKEPDFLTEIRDSKKISEKKREKLFDLIMKSEDILVEVAQRDPQTIDQINIFEATKRAMEEAILKLGEEDALVIIDGNFAINIEREQKSIIKADQKILECSIASIAAKVSRDRLMRGMDKKYPGYGFSCHKGYPTKAHKEAIKKLGPCPIHRRSFKLI